MSSTRGSSTATHLFEAWSASTSVSSAGSGNVTSSTGGHTIGSCSTCSLPSTGSSMRSGGTGWKDRIRKRLAKSSRLKRGGRGGCEGQTKDAPDAVEWRLRADLPQRKPLRRGDRHLGVASLLQAAPDHGGGPQGEQRVRMSVRKRPRRSAHRGRPAAGSRPAVFLPDPRGVRNHKRRNVHGGKDRRTRIAQLARAR